MSIRVHLLRIASCRRALQRRLPVPERSLQRKSRSNADRTGDRIWPHDVRDLRARSCRRANLLGPVSDHQRLLSDKYVLHSNKVLVEPGLSIDVHSPCPGRSRRKLRWLVIALFVQSGPLLRSTDVAMYGSRRLRRALSIRGRARPSSRQPHGRRVRCPVFMSGCSDGRDMLVKRRCGCLLPSRFRLRLRARLRPTMRGGRHGWRGSLRRDRNVWRTCVGRGRSALRLHEHALPRGIVYRRRELDISHALRRRRASGHVSRNCCGRAIRRHGD
jgi:hypothetical protein